MIKISCSSHLKKRKGTCEQICGCLTLSMIQVSDLRVYMKSVCFQKCIAYIAIGNTQAPLFSIRLATQRVWDLNIDVCQRFFFFINKNKLIQDTRHNEHKICSIQKQYKQSICQSVCQLIQGIYRILGKQNSISVSIKIFVYIIAKCFLYYSIY